MINVAAGLAIAGKIVFCYSIASFATLRCLEQIKVNICSMNLPVTIIGAGAGFSFGYDGPTHHGHQDVSSMRLLPEMSILELSSNDVAVNAIDYVLEKKTPCYIRLDKGPFPNWSQMESDFTKGYRILRPLSDVNLISNGFLVREVINAAKNNDCAIRIGVNSGSLEKDILEKYKEPCPEALVESAIRNIEIIEEENFFNFKVSVKSSDVFLSIAAYRQLSKLINYPLHLGITESGSFIPGSIKSSIGLGILLLEGIGDTIRVSLSDDPVKEVKIGNEILKSLNLRNRGVKIISCPSCARQGFQVIDTVKLLEEKLSHIKIPITLSIIGCVVNGPGEAALTDIGITGGGKNSNMLYLKGVRFEKLSNQENVPKLVELVEKKVEEIEKKN